VFENRVLKEVCGSKRDEVMGEWRKLHNGKLHDLYCSLNIISLIKLWRRGWAGHVAYSGEKRNAYGIRVGKWNKETTWKTKALMGR
jgi:hypothetical protein